MRSAALRASLGAAGAAAVALALVAATDERTLAFTTNVRVAGIVAVAQPGEAVCQRGLEAAAEFDVVKVRLGTGQRPGPPLDLVVREAGTARVLARGRMAPGALDNRDARARVAPAVAEGSAIEVCLRNRGTREAGLYGGPPRESPGHAFVEGRPGRGDVHLVFFRSEPRSALSLVPDMFERATRFRPDVVGAWTFWVLLAAVAGGVPLLLAGALRAATRERGGPQDPP